MKITGNPPECGRGNLLAFQICKSTKIAGKGGRNMEIFLQCVRMSATCEYSVFPGKWCVNFN